MPVQKPRTIVALHGHEALRERLAAQKTPAYWIWVEAWPLTGSGKIQKFKLAEAFAAGEHMPLTA